ncbi:MAG TPA: 3-oxoacyl-[acyl-carrier-protein] reductase [Clostridia bacterium]|jgi:3-oxoacyl-[acyl-carrier protein] reductase|nr:3-oxoacyl-[acyl-carrier-protein] reductase [Clostridia bacterium]
MLTEQVVLITGASRGIGRAIAIAFAEKGAQVIVNYKGNLAAAEEVKAIIEKNGGLVEILQADVSQAEQVKKMLAHILKKYGKIDVLVNNAGINRDTLIMRMKDEAWDKVIQTNLTAAFYCLREVTRPMLKQRSGRIINIASVVGLHGNVGQANYAAAKAGLIGLTKSAAQELAPRGIMVNAIAPGFIDTDMTRQLPEQIQEKIKTQIPVGHWGEPVDVAQLAVFLASPQAAYITGQVIAVDGGLTM